MTDVVYLGKVAAATLGLPDVGDDRHWTYDLPRSVSVTIPLANVDPALIAIVLGRRWPPRVPPLYPHDSFGWTRRAKGRPRKRQAYRGRRG